LGKSRSFEISPTSSLVAQAPIALTFDSKISAPSRYDEILASIAKERSTPRYQVAELLSAIYGGNPPSTPAKCFIEGAFFTGHLLYQGWWNRSGEDADLSSGEWRGGEAEFANIRRWLNAGYELWGPSWDISNSESDGQYLFGQIGHHDEADSLHVIIAPKAARALMAKMQEEKKRSGALAAFVSAYGTLYDDQQLENLSANTKKAISMLASAGGSTMRYFLVIEDRDTNDASSKDKIDILPARRGSIYSAYLWQSLIRKSHIDLYKSGALHLPDTIYIWEHTNLMDRDSVKFNYASLVSKKGYLEKVLGDKLCVLHQSYSVGGVVTDIDEEPLVSVGDLTAIIDMTRGGMKTDDNVLQFRHRPKDRD
jgi:hypothetical protein